MVTADGALATHAGIVLPETRRSVVRGAGAVVPCGNMIRFGGAARSDPARRRAGSPSGHARRLVGRSSNLAVSAGSARHDIAAHMRIYRTFVGTRTLA